MGRADLRSRSGSGSSGRSDQHSESAQAARCVAQAGGDGDDESLTHGQKCLCYRPADPAVEWGPGGSAMKPRILVTNDDGIYSEGLRKLADALRSVGDVVIVAPDREQSAASHALTLNRPLRLLKVAPDEWIVDGTPTDCVNLAVLSLLKGARPD